MSKTLKLTLIVLILTLVIAGIIVFGRFYFPFRVQYFFRPDLSVSQRVFVLLHGPLADDQFVKTQLEICYENTTAAECAKMPACKWQNVCMTTIDCGFSGELDYRHVCIPTSTTDFAREMNAVDSRRCAQFSDFECALHPGCIMNTYTCVSTFRR